MNKRICLIPARSGSKRIPNKNIKIFHGKPLIAWSIEEALNSDLFDDVYVSTDSHDIEKVANKYGAKVPFLRPKDISDDFANDKDVRNHFISWMKRNNINADTLCYLYPTAPFVTKEILIGVDNLLKNTNVQMAMTITSYAHPIMRSFKLSDNGLITYAWEEYRNKRSQDLPEFFHDAGICYQFDLTKIEKNDPELISGYKVPRLRCQDIDNEEDFNFAENLFKLIKDKKF
tara:strand:+ start:1704 stop:2396 length:693 start_codon:yes stop_codon:yes gene_type:complete